MKCVDIFSTLFLVCGYVKISVWNQVICCSAILICCITWENFPLIYIILSFNMVCGVWCNWCCYLMLSRDGNFLTYKFNFIKKTNEIEIEICFRIRLEQISSVTSKLEWSNWTNPKSDELQVEKTKPAEFSNWSKLEIKSYFLIDKSRIKI